MTRPLEELLSDEDAWPDVEGWVAAAGDRAEILPARREDGERALLELQVTTRSVLGAIALHAAAIRVDGGWVRVLGAGGRDHPPSLLDPAPGSAKQPPGRETGLIVASDALGGFFAVNGGGLPGEPGEVAYLAPDTLRWEPLELGNEAWLRWLLEADLDEWYGPNRWPGWREEIEGLAPDRAIHTHPPLFTKEGGDVAAAHRRPVPIGELWSLWHDFRAQMGVED